MKRILELSILATLSLLLCATAAAALDPATVSQPNLTLAGARQVMAAAVAYAKANQAPGGAIAIVDNGGHLITFDRLDGTFTAAPEISIGKARTAALFRRPTRVFEELVNKGRTTMVTLPDFTPLQGGVPIMLGEQVVGAIGVSGAASAAQDEEIAIAGAAAAGMFAATSSADVTYLDHDRVELAFAHGEPLLEVSGYKVHASRRDAPGEAEIHERDTDIIYVLEGRATFVTGGKLVSGATTEPNELRGRRIDEGEARQLVAGDVIVVPHGTPHWFSDVAEPFLYYVVKVAS